MNENNKNSDNLKSKLEQALMLLKQVDEIIAINPKNENNHFLKKLCIIICIFSGITYNRIRTEL
jgi:hypothetical protein